MDKDLASIQETRDLIKIAVKAQKEFLKFTQSQVDEFCKEIAELIEDNAYDIAKLAHVETGFGKTEDKVIKNNFAGREVYESIKDMKTVGYVNGSIESGYAEIAEPVGVIAALIPSTNPTSTAIYKIMLAIKTRNAIVLSPHPAAVNSIMTTCKLINARLVEKGLPEGIINCISKPSIKASNELMTSESVALILATGGTPMVKAAYSSGTPAIGVGPGNGPSLIHKSANIEESLRKILKSKTFDNGVICASEQSIVITNDQLSEVESNFKKLGFYLLDDVEKSAVEKVIYNFNGTMNAKTVGKSAVEIANIAGITVPACTQILVGKETKIGRTYPFSMEKLCPVLGLYVVNNFDEQVNICEEILLFEGKGHTMGVHTNDNSIIQTLAERMPVNRVLINTYQSLGGIGFSTDLAPALTLGCGAVGKSSTSDNITPMHLLNLKRIAMDNGKVENNRQDKRDLNLDDKAIEQIVLSVLQKLK